MDWQSALNTVLIILIWVGGINLSIALFIFVLYLPSIMQKKINLKEAIEIKEENIQVVEEAIFFKSNSKFQEIINNQMKDIRELSAKKKSLLASLADLEKEKTRKSK
jgi:predicted Holliday junction resolvase-like endonuclease